MRDWLDRSEWPLAVVAVLFLIGYAWPILQPGLAPTAKHTCNSVVIGSWLVFIADYAARLWTARNRRKYFTKHLLDLLIVALPALRPLRLLRLLALFRILNRKAAKQLQGRVALYVSISAGTLVACGALAVLDAERHATGHQLANRNIDSFGDALWWAITTVTTVGYGDRYPVTVQGRFVAVGLMIGGVALIGVVTASFAAWFIGRVRKDDDARDAARDAADNVERHEVAMLVQQIDVLTREVRTLRAAVERADQRERLPG